MNVFGIFEALVGAYSLYVGVRQKLWFAFVLGLGFCADSVFRFTEVLFPSDVASGILEALLGVYTLYTGVSQRLWFAFLLGLGFCIFCVFRFTGAFVLSDIAVLLIIAGGILAIVNAPGRSGNRAGIAEGRR